jgi:deoxyhypusine synthase
MAQVVIRSADPADFGGIRTCPIRERANKFHLAEMIPAGSAGTFRDAGLTEVAERIRVARRAEREVILMLGGAVIKEGCSLLVIDLMRQGLVTHLAVNGAVSIHDFEIAMIGATSEDVAEGLRTGMFGMAEETGRWINEALREAAGSGEGYGLAVGRAIHRRDLPHRESSILGQAYALRIPLTVHIAIGGDIVHQHPCCDGAALGATSFTDFRILTASVSRLARGVVLNVGSAVNLPEVFLKALTIARNLGHDVREFTTANFDFLDMYRPRTRIVEWPRVLGCTGFDVRGRHRDTIPALHRALTAREL